MPENPDSDAVATAPDDGQPPASLGGGAPVATSEEPVGELGIAVALEQFSGPMDLLLYLVRRLEVDVRDLPITAIADQFATWVASVEDLDLEQAGDFVVMAATLLEIKARMIAPPPAGTEVPDDGEDDFDPRAGLIRRLLVYRAAKEAAFDLDRRDAERRLRHERGHREVVPDDPGEVDAWELKDVDVGALSTLWFDLLKRIDGLGPRTVIVDDMPMGVRMAQLAESLRSRGECHLSEFFALEPGKISRVGLVMAVLESTRQRYLQIRQGEQYGDVLMRYRPEDERAVASGDPGPPEQLPKRQRRPPLVTWSRADGTVAELVEPGEGESGDEPPIENEEQRFLRELESGIGVERLLNRSADLELGFIAWWEETYPGQPLPPGVIKSVPPPPEPPAAPVVEQAPATVVEQPAKPKRTFPRPRPVVVVPAAEVVATVEIPDPSPQPLVAIGLPSPVCLVAIPDPQPVVGEVVAPDPDARVVEVVAGVMAVSAPVVIPEPVPEPSIGLVTLVEAPTDPEPVRTAETEPGSEPAAVVAITAVAVPIADSVFAPVAVPEVPAAEVVSEPAPPESPPEPEAARTAEPLAAAVEFIADSVSAPVALSEESAAEVVPEAASPEITSAESVIHEADVVSAEPIRARAPEPLAVQPEPAIAAVVAVVPDPPAPAPESLDTPVAEPAPEAASKVGRWHPTDATFPAGETPALPGGPTFEAAWPAPEASPPSVQACVVPEVDTPVVFVAHLSATPPAPPPDPDPPPGPPPVRSTSQILPPTTTPILPSTTSRPMSHPNHIRFAALAALNVLVLVVFGVWFYRPAQVLTLVGGPDGGVVSRDAEMAWTLNLPLEDHTTAALPQIAPPIAGTFAWRDARTVVFTPSGALPADAQLLVTFPAGLRAAGSFRFPDDAVPVRSLRTLPMVSVVEATLAAPAFGEGSIVLALNRAPADPQALMNAVTVIPSVPFTAVVVDGGLRLSGAFVPGSTYRIAVATPAQGHADDQPASWSRDVVMPKRSPGVRLQPGVHAQAVLEAVGIDLLVVEAGSVRETLRPVTGSDGVARVEVPSWLLTDGAQHLAVRWSGGSTTLAIDRQRLQIDPADLAPALGGGTLPVVSVR